MSHDDMLDDFFVEVDELFGEAEDSLFSIEKPDQYNESFNSVFRAFHSVKGAAGMFGFAKLQSHMHHVEDLLEKRKGGDSISAEMVDYLLSSIDAARKIINNEEVDFDYYDPDNKEAVQVKTLTKERKEQIENKVKVRIEEGKAEGYVYLVDDEEEILEISELVLSEVNYRVKKFTSAKDCLESLKTEVPDLIVTDINMPGMTGVDLLHEVHKIKPHLPVMVVSGYVTKEVCLDTIAAGVSGIIEKPFEADKFITMVSNSVKKYQAIKLLNKSIDLIVYQYEDFDKFLFKVGGDIKRKTFRDELKNILVQKKKLFEKLN